MSNKQTFKKLINKKIDTNDELIIKTKKIIGLDKPILSGSYVKYGREKACDLDMSENISVNSSEEIYSMTQQFIKNLLKYKDDFILVKIKFYIYDMRISNIIKNMGYVNGMFEIINFNNIDSVIIDDSLPKNIIKKITLLINKIKNSKTSQDKIDNYNVLYCYLYDLNSPKWTLNEINKHTKKINGKNINLYNSMYNDIYIELIVDNFKVSNYIHFNNNDVKNNNNMYKTFELHDVVVNNKLSYYKFLKLFQHFIKWCYFNKIFRESYVINNTVKLYNDIYKFREEVGDSHNNICLLDNMIFLCKDKNKKKELQDEYKKKYNIFNNMVKKYYNKISTPYQKYLRNYFRSV